METYINGHIAAIHPDILTIVIMTIEVRQVPQGLQDVLDATESLVLEGVKALPVATVNVDLVVKGVNADLVVKRVTAVTVDLAATMVDPEIQAQPELMGGEVLMDHLGHLDLLDHVVNGAIADIEASAAKRETRVARDQLDRQGSVLPEQLAVREPLELRDRQVLVLRAQLDRLVVLDQPDQLGLRELLDLRVQLGLVLPVQLAPQVP
jgi:hypothetical protein